MDWQPISSNPTDDAIEAIIQQATSNAPLRSPLRDTRTQLFVGNLPYRVRWQDLKDLFRKAGTVLRADVSLGPDNRSRGYGTVLLATAEDAGRAVDTFNGYSWQSRILQVRLDRQLQEFDSPVPPINSNYLSVKDDPVPSTPIDPNSCTSLCVGNLPFHCQWQDLKDLFRQAGTIIRADVILGPDGRSRGFGTVVFATELDAERALKMFNGYEYNGRILNVHRDDKYYSTLPESPLPPSSSVLPQPTQITLPPGYMLDLVPPSPNDMPNYDHQHQRQSQIQQLQSQLQQQYHHQSQHQTHQQQRGNLYHTSPLSQSNTTTSSGSDKSSEVFSRFSSTSATSLASSVSNSLPFSRPHSQGYLHGQGHEQRARGQSLQISSPHSISSPQSTSASPHPQHRSSSSHSSLARSSESSPPYTNSTSSNCGPSPRPSSSKPNHHHRPGPISLPPPLLSSQVAVNIPLQQLSPHGHPPLGMSVSVSVSPLVEYPGYGLYQQQQQQQFGQHVLPSFSMPSFTMASESPLPPGANAGGGDKHTRSRSKLEADSEFGVDEDENVWNNSRVSDRTWSPPTSSSTSSSTRQRYPHHQQHQQPHHRNEQPQQQQFNAHIHSTEGQQQQPSYQPLPRASSSNAQLASNTTTSTHGVQQPILPLHINLNSVPGAFSPCVVMSPGTFYGRPGEVPTFINAAVGAPLTLKAGGVGHGASQGEEGGGGSSAQMQEGQGQGGQAQWYHHHHHQQQQQQTHGSYFYAMSSPNRRKTPSSGMEPPKGYFDPLYFPVGGSGGGGGVSLVNTIMKDGHATSLGVEEGEGKEEGEKRERGGDDDDSRDGEVDDDSGEDEEEEAGRDKEYPPLSSEVIEAPV